MNKIAIRRHPTRGKEVIQILKSFGGYNKYEFCGIGREPVYYYINKYGIIEMSSESDLCNSKLYTLEEFEKEFPFKIGDKVTFKNGIHPQYTIKKFTIWHDGDVVCQFVENELHYSIYKLKLCKEMNTRNIALTLDKAKEWYNKGGELKEVALQAYSEEELTKVELPKSWEEFCNNYLVKKEEYYINEYSDVVRFPKPDNTRNIKTDRNTCPSQKSAEAHLALIQLEQLRDCWRQGWEPTLEKDTYSIKTYRGKLGVFCYCTSEVLSFPTREMAEKFLKCFRDLIEKAGDLI